jgi:hypothetical protein
LKVLESGAEVFDGLEIGVGLKGGLDGFAGLRGEAYAFATIYITWVWSHSAFANDVDVRLIPVPGTDTNLKNGSVAVAVLKKNVKRVTHREFVFFVFFIVAGNVIHSRF